MSRPSLQRYAVVRAGRVVDVILRADTDGPPRNLPPGAVLMLEADAVAAGLPRDDIVANDVTGRSQQAVQLNLTSAQQAAAIADAAAAVASGTGTISNPQLTTIVRQLAAWIATLAHDDLVGSRQRAALILRNLTDFDPVGVPPVKTVITVTPGEATADGPAIS